MQYVPRSANKGALLSRHTLGKDLALNNFMRRLAFHHALSSKFLTALGAGAIARRVVFRNALDEAFYQATASALVVLVKQRLAACTVY